MSQRAYTEIRRMIVALDYAPGDVLSEGALQDRLAIGRTPIREALQRLARDQFVTVIPRRGMFVSPVDVDDLALLCETRIVLEPYAARLAARRGTPAHWRAMDELLESVRTTDDPEALLDVDRSCHEIMWSAAGNRFLTDQLDTMYAHSQRVWHLYLADVADMRAAVEEHAEILDVLEDGAAEEAGRLVERHVGAFDAEVRTAVARRLGTVATPH